VFLYGFIEDVDKVSKLRDTGEIGPSLFPRGDKFEYLGLDFVISQSEVCHIISAPNTIESKFF